ncbi:hypothetical protein, partial [Pseudomonas aeruginosa]|uniref:hypothetical protein n=1 Tax=Pseudomonas aeruginosa TaxID=287 RepID=UPI003983372F
MGAYKIESHIFSVPLEWEKLVALGAEVDPWQSDAGRTTQLTAGAEARTWRSDSGRITQLAAGAEVSS